MLSLYLSDSLSRPLPDHAFLDDCRALARPQHNDVPTENHPLIVQIDEANSAPA